MTTAINPIRVILADDHTLVRAGIPQTPALSPMPQFSDLSEQQIGDLARWIHHARAEGGSSHRP